MPVVSPNEIESAPSATARLATASTRSTGTSPSYGQPQAVETITWQGRAPLVRLVDDDRDLVQRLLGAAG